MSENPQSQSLADDELPDDIPLGNFEPLLVPTPLGQSFLQLKFIYPLGAVSIINPNNLNTESDFELLSDSFNESPFFDHPLQTTESVSPSIANSQPNLQTKAITSLPQPSKRSPQASPQNTSTHKNSVTSSPLSTSTNNSPSFSTKQTELQTSIANSSPVNNSPTLQSNSSDEQSSSSEALNKLDISSDLSEDTPIQRYTDTSSSPDYVTPVIGDIPSSVGKIEKPISQEVQNNLISPQLIQRESDPNTFDSNSSDAIFADNLPTITSLQESEANARDVTSTDNSDIPNIQSKSASQVNNRSDITFRDIAKETSRDFSLNNNSPSIQRISELSQSSLDDSNQDYERNIQLDIYNTDTSSSANTADSDVN
ncbi:MAG TPA: hypothetical protein DCZ88_17205, partial [Pseudanabaena sp.]|nr:hypothetical protein [Pseudanabaena sp.]